MLPYLSSIFYGIHTCWFNETESQNFFDNLSTDTEVDLTTLRDFLVYALDTINPLPFKTIGTGAVETVNSLRVFLQSELDKIRILGIF